MKNQNIIKNLSVKNKELLLEEAKILKDIIFLGTPNFNEGINLINQNRQQRKNNKTKIIKLKKKSTYYRVF